MNKDWSKLPFTSFDLMNGPAFACGGYRSLCQQSPKLVSGQACSCYDSTMKIKIEITRVIRLPLEVNHTQQASLLEKKRFVSVLTQRLRVPKRRA